MSSTLRSITNRDTEVKNNFKYNVNKSYLNYTGKFTPGGEDKATLESDLSASPGPSGVSSPVFYSPDGFNAVNSTGENPTTSILPKALSGAGLDSDSDSDSFSPSGGFIIPNIINCDTVGPGCSTLPVIIEKFSRHRSKLAGTPCIFLHLRNRKDQSEAVYKYNPKSHSRYFPEGRENIKESIRQRLGSEIRTGVFFSLTVAAKKYEMQEAWATMWPRFKKFRDALNMYRRRNMNAGHSFQYMAVLESCESGYPHLHVFCPGLGWLIKREDLQKMDDWWEMGSANTEKEYREESAQSYILKYISKLEGWSEPSMAMLWYHRLRLYNLSHIFYEKVQDPEWEIVDRYNTTEEMRKKLNISDSDVEKIIDTWRSLVPIEPGV